MRATHKADDFLAANGITSWTFRQSRMYWKQARTFAKRHDGRLTKLKSKKEPSDINQAERISEARRTNQGTQRPQRSHERHGLAHRGTRRLEMELHGKQLCKQRTQTTNKNHDPDRHDHDNHTNSSWTNNVYDWSPLRRRYITRPLPTNRKLILMKTEAMTNNSECFSDIVQRECITPPCPAAGTGPLHSK